MSESIFYNTVTSTEQTVTETRPGYPSHEYRTYISYSSQKQQRPKSAKTPKNGSAYVIPTAWSHRGCFTTAPTVSGSVRPYGLSWTTEFSYTNGLVNVGCPDQVWVSVSDFEDLVASATTKCLLNLKDQKVNLGVSLAEAKEVAEFVGNTARRVANMLEGAANRRPKEWFDGIRKAGTKNWKNIPGYYLEYVYGVAPFLSDVDGACQQLAESLNRGNSPLVTARGRLSDVEQEDFALSPMTQFGQLRGLGSRTRMAEVGIAAEAPEWVMQDYSSLGVTNPFSIAWERVPYSHVVDWFLPVGNWINTWDVGNYLRFKSGYTTRFAVREGAAVYVQNPNATVWQVRSDIPGRYKHFSMTRDTVGQFPSASFPSLKNPLSLDHMAQGLAMLSQVVRGHTARARRG